MIVNGSVGNDAGSEMMGGNLIVEGNAGYDLGKGMRGGSITVKGDAGGSCGAEMENGAISVNGNAGERLGSGMAGGEIIVEGNAGDLAGYIMAGGSITIKGDSGSHAGNDMIDGMITIAGDCKDHFAIGRTGGEIHVAGKHGGLGARMHGSISRKMDDVFTTGPSREERMIHGMKRFWEKNEKRGIFNSGLHLPHNTRRDEGEIRIIYSKVIREIAPLLSTGYTAKDIEGISIALGEAEHADNFAPLSGLLMSALINHCKDNDFIVHTDHFKWSGMEFLGYRNTKNIFVDGSTCDYTGMRMRAGSLTINGYGGDYLGRNMMGGTITLNGHAYLNLGYGMSGGKIIVNGDAYHTSLAERMIGGEIHINGELKDRQGYLKDLFAGKIYHKGEEML
jgi:formylmethanofuran dehydrogenase subunit C